MRRFLWFSILLGTAVALFFGAAASPAYAHCKGKHSPPHEHCTLDTIFSLTTEGKYYFKVQGATIVDAKQAKALLDQGVVIFDMRGDSSWEAGHVKGALHADAKYRCIYRRKSRQICQKDPTGSLLLRRFHVKTFRPCLRRGRDMGL